MLLTSLLLSCVQPLPLPYVGECAEYPEGVYDFGEIGVGSCLAGPMSMTWIEHPTQADSWVLLVPNANPYLDFTGGNVVALDLSGVTLDGTTHLVHEVASSALDMPSFPSHAALIPERDLLAVPNRLTDDSRTRVGDDALYFLDVSDPTELAFAPAAAGGEIMLTLGSDPDLPVYDADQGRLYAVNLTDHTVAVIDALANPIDVIDAVPTAWAGDEAFFDADLSGSYVEVGLVDVVIPENVQDDDWSLRFAEGSYRLWVPGLEGVYRVTSQGDEDWARSNMAYDLDGPGDTDGLLGPLMDPQIWAGSTSVWMLYTDSTSGAIHIAEAGAALAFWTHFPSSPIIEPNPGAWDEIVGGAMAFTIEGETFLYYDGQDAAGSGGIGLALSVDDVNFDRQTGGPIVGPGSGPHDSVRAADPYVIYDFQADLWRMYYGAWDGATWRVGHAISDDKITWFADGEAVFEDETGAHAAAPVVAYVDGEFRMWTSRSGADGAWSVGLATSVDGHRWVDEGPVLDMEGEPVSGEPPGLGLQAQTSLTWSLHSASLGSIGAVLDSGGLFTLEDFGFQVLFSVGARLGPDDASAVGDDAANGVSPGAWLVDEGLIYATLVGTDGLSRIGVGAWNDGQPTIDAIALDLPAGVSAVASPVVFGEPGAYQMLYAQSEGGRTTTWRATSADGLSWAVAGEVLAGGDGWDSVEISPGSVTSDGSGGLLLWYSGYDGERYRIGLAASDDGSSWSRVEGSPDQWVFEEGTPGEFDDTLVREPAVLRDEDAGVYHLWYTGDDGDSSRVGYATHPLVAGAPAPDDWTRAEDPEDETARAVLGLFPGAFDGRDVTRPVATWSEAVGYRLLYSGWDGAVPRGGLAVGLEPDRLYRAPRPATAGDSVTFETRRGDESDETAIPLEAVVEGISVSGIGGSQTLYDPERGVLFVASKLASFLYAIDVRDDSTDLWEDRNYLDIEALLVAESTSGATGFRGMHLPAGSDVLYAVNDAPESVMMVDLSGLVDDDVADFLRDAVVGYLATPRGFESDEGADTFADVGPSQLVSRGDDLFVANFNDNSIGVYDLRLGTYGALVHTIDVPDENPHALSISPDGRLMAVANYVGDVSTGRSSSTLAFVDIDPASPSYLEIVAWIANQ